MCDGRRFQSQWALGIPVVVRNIHRKFDWTPECMMRATRDVRAARNAGELCFARALPQRRHDGTLETLCSGLLSLILSR